MILACHDVEHLQRVRSPLLEHLEGVPLDAETVRYFHREYLPALREIVPGSPLGERGGDHDQNMSRDHPMWSKPGEMTGRGIPPEFHRRLR